MHTILRINRLGTIYSGLALFALSTVSMASAATLCVNPGGTSGCWSTISAAVAAASPGDLIQVANGKYKEQVTITETLSLVAMDPAKPPTIDATGLSNGIFVNGLSAAPNTGVAHVVISGFNIHNAKYEGILILNATDVTVVDNHVFDNNKALDLNTSPVSCPGIPLSFETNEQADCGEGIHLIAANRSTILHNEVDGNSGGILTTDETGPSYINVISGNYVHENPYACGITMASHGPAVTLLPSAKISFGIYRNTVSNNESARNGLGLPGAGAGVGIFAAGPGYRSNKNVVINNSLHGNGLPGVTMHNHAAAPGAPVPPGNLDNNVIIGNKIFNNAADTEDAMTAGPTGINIYSKVPVLGTVISQNVFEDEAIDIAFNVPSGGLDIHFNNFSAGATGVVNLGTGNITATENWWHCAAGPGASDCSTATGKSLNFTPWLTAPFVP